MKSLFVCWFVCWLVCLFSPQKCFSTVCLTSVFVKTGTNAWCIEKTCIPLQQKKITITTHGMKQIIPILSITGSDSTGGAGIQGDIKTIAALGGYAVTVLTSVTVQNLQGVQDMHALPCEVVKGQLRAVLGDIAPKAVKVGMLGTIESAKAIANELKHEENVVYAPGIESSHGKLLAESWEMIDACKTMFPCTKLLVMKMHDVELLLNIKLASNEDIVKAAAALKQYGPRNVLIYGGYSSYGLLTNVLLTETDHAEYFTLNDTDNWKTHGLGSTISSAIATFLAKGFGVTDSVNAAHEYVRSLVLYSVELHGGNEAKLLKRDANVSISDRQVELYNKLMQLVAANYRTQHDVLFYADELCVTTRYLAQITRRVSGKSPKRLIDEYIVHESTREIVSTQKPIQAIAFEFGYTTQAQFTKFFKKYKGTSPSKLRR